MFTVTFGSVQRRHNKIPVGAGATLEHRPHNFLAMGAIARIVPSHMLKTLICK